MVGMKIYKAFNIQFWLVLLPVFVMAGGYSNDFTSVKQAGTAGTVSFVNSDAALLFSQPAAMSFTRRGISGGAHAWLPRTTFVEQGTNLTFNSEKEWLPLPFLAATFKPQSDSSWAFGFGIYCIRDFTS